MNPDLIFKLLAQVNKYYSIGRPSDNYRFPGYQILLEKIERKIARVQNNSNEPWDSLIKQVDLDLNPKIKTLNLAASQFPNYKLLIILNEGEENKIEEKRFLHLTISLLVDNFTIFFEKRVKLLAYENTTSKIIYYGVKNSDTEEKEYIAKVKNIVSNYFSHLTFIPHKELFGIKITGGHPHHEDTETLKSEYSFYHYLFERDDILEKEVIE